MTVPVQRSPDGGPAMSLLHGPRLLILDEPFEAVDPVSAALIRDILQRYVAGGGTVVFSSHVMEVVERLCSLPTSVRAAYALPDSTNPFAMSSGGGLAKGLLTFAAILAAIVGTLPLQLAAYLLGDVWLWVGLPVGLAYGTAAYLLGSRLAGDLVDRRMPELLAAVSPHR